MRVKTEKSVALEALDLKELTLMIPGFEVPLTAEEADLLGAFEETAVSYEDAQRAAFDVLEAGHEPE